MMVAVREGLYIVRARIENTRDQNDSGSVAERVGRELSQGQVQ